MSTRKFALPTLAATTLLIAALACNVPLLSSSPSATTEAIPAAVFTEVAGTMNARLTVTAQGTPVAPAAPSTAEMTIVAQMTATSQPPTAAATQVVTQPPAAPAQPTETQAVAVNPTATPTPAAPDQFGGVPTVVPIFPPTVVPTFIIPPTVVATFMTPPTVIPTLMTVPTLVGTSYVAPTVIPTFIATLPVIPTLASVPILVPTVVPTLINAPTVAITSIAIPTVAPTSILIPTVIPTYVTPPVPTPTQPSVSSAGFNITNTNLNWCNGIPWAIFTIYNASGDALESLQLYLQDVSMGTGLYGPPNINTPFMISDKACSTGGDTLAWGATSFIGAPLGSGNLKGHTIQATVRLCSKEDQGGKCYQKVLQFIIP